jgi:hypothetical protein
MSNNGEFCFNGHLNIPENRSSVNGTCLLCNRARAKKFSVNNPEKKKNNYLKDKNYYSEATRLWAVNNRERNRELHRKIHKKLVLKITKSYAASVLGLKVAELDDDVYELYKLNLTLKREMWNERDPRRKNNQ